jgi:hypothetical protein
MNNECAKCIGNCVKCESAFVCEVCEKGYFFNGKDNLIKVSDARLAGITVESATRRVKSAQNALKATVLPMEIASNATH